MFRNLELLQLLSNLHLSRCVYIYIYILTSAGVDQLPLLFPVGDGYQPYGNAAKGYPFFGKVNGEFK